MSTKSADHRNKESEATPVEEEQKSSKGRKSLKSRSPAAMRDKVKKSPTPEKVEDHGKTDEPKQSLGVEKKSRQKSRSPAGNQRSVSPKKAVKKTENTSGEELAEGKKAKKLEGGVKVGKGGKGAAGGKGGAPGPKVNSGRSSQNKARSPSPQLPVKTDQEKFEELFLVRRNKTTFS